MIANNYKARVPKEHLEKVIPQLQKVQHHMTSKVEGCVKFQVSQDLKDKSIVYILAIWETKEHYEKNLDAEYFNRELVDKFIEFDAAIISAEQYIIAKSTDVV